MALFLQRDTKVYLKKTVASSSQYWEIPVLEGFSFSQGNETTETVLNEMADANGNSRRGRRLFNDALSPAEWSFSTYIRPFRSAAGDNKAGAATENRLIEEILWAQFVGDGGWTVSNSGLATVGTIGTVSDATNGVYYIGQDEYTDNSTAGAGAAFEITITGGNTASVVVTNPGTGYAIGETFTIPAELVGDNSVDLTFNAATLTGADPDYNYDLQNFVFGTVSDPTEIFFTGGNQAELGTFDLYFVMKNDNPTTADNYTSAEVTAGKFKIYELTGCVVNEATINFDVDGIAQIDWSGNASEINDAASLDVSAASGTPNGLVAEDIEKTDNFIRNKLTALTCTAADTTNFPGASTNGVYNFTLTGGSITFSNNITFLTPETLGTVNTPIGHITGNKSVSGNFTCYIDAGTAGDSADFYSDMLTDGAKEIITNEFELTFALGGTAGTPRFEINLPTAHMEIPVVNIEEVISVDMNFHGLPSAIDRSDEAKLSYVGAA